MVELSRAGHAYPPHTTISALASTHATHDSDELIRRPTNILGEESVEMVVEVQEICSLRSSVEEKTQSRISTFFSTQYGNHTWTLPHHPPGCLYIQ
jgi:hypothetical protein